MTPPTLSAAAIPSTPPRLPTIYADHATPALRVMRATDALLHIVRRGAPLDVAALRGSVRTLGQMIERLRDPLRRRLIGAFLPIEREAQAAAPDGRLLEGFVEELERRLAAGMVEGAG